ncbi:MAG: ROK family protein, partial [Candidatus Weimeria sp.]
MNQTGMNMASLKKLNQYKILRYLNANGSASRHELAEKMGLTPASLTQITRRLKTVGLLRECGEYTESGKGRKQILLEVNPDWRYIVSISIEVNKTTAAITDLLGNEHSIISIPADTDSDPDSYLRKVCHSVIDMMDGFVSSYQKKNGRKPDFMGVSVGIPGIVDRDAGTSIRAYGIWDVQVDVAGVIGKELDMPVSVENNVNAFASAELIYGEGRKHDDLLLVKWGPGVGSTIVTGGEIYEGRGGKAAELGHLIVKKHGRKCTCGKCGCLETEISLEAVMLKLRNAGLSEKELEPDFADIYDKTAGNGSSAAEVLEEVVD